MYRLLLPLLLLLLALSTPYSASAQTQDTVSSLTAKPQNPDSFWRRVKLGGLVGFQFGSITGITVSPEASVRTVDQLFVGLRLIYQYYNYKNYFWDDMSQQYMSYESSVYGGGIYLRYYLGSLFQGFLANLFAHVEYEYLSYTIPYSSSPAGRIYDPYGNRYVPGKSVVEVNSFFVGGGYRQPLGSRVGIDFMILFNLNDSYSSPYSNPIFRFGVGVGL